MNRMRFLSCTSCQSCPNTQDARRMLMEQIRSNGTLAERKRIIVLATLDTKSQEAAFVADCIRQRGHQPWLVDLSIAGVSPFPGDTSREAVASAASTTVSAIAALQRAEAMEVAATGATSLV